MDVNYYEELGLNKDESLEDINRTLSQLESIWKRREINTPEKAAKMIALIVDARTVFASEQSRREYDASMINDYSDTEQEYLNGYNKAFNDARFFSESKQNDLAKLAIDKARSLMNKVGLTDNEKISFYARAASIYFNNSDYNDALDMANNMIFIDSDFLDAYVIKETVLNCILQNNPNTSNKQQIINNYRSTCDVLIKKSLEQNNTSQASDAFYYLGMSYVAYDPQDYDIAEQCANEVLKISPDHSGAINIINILNSPMKINPNNLFDTLITKYESEKCNCIEEINKATAAVLENIHFLGVYSQVISNRRMQLVYPSDGVLHAVNYEIILENTGTWCLCGNDKMQEEETRAYIGSNKIRDIYTTYPNMSDDLLREFDFDGSVTFSDRHDHGVIKDLNLFDSFPLPYKQIHLTRLYRKKGMGLLTRLNEVLMEQEGLIKKKEEENERQRQEDEKKAEELRIMIENDVKSTEYKKQGKCEYCGGEFKGFLTKKCTRCGKPKSY